MHCSFAASSVIHGTGHRALKSRDIRSGHKHPAPAPWRSSHISLCPALSVRRVHELGLHKRGRKGCGDSEGIAICSNATSIPSGLVMQALLVPRPATAIQPRMDTLVMDERDVIRQQQWGWVCLLRLLASCGRNRGRLQQDNGTKCRRETAHNLNSK